MKRREFVKTVTTAAIAAGAGNSLIAESGAKKDLVAPSWSADKKRVLNYLTKVLQEP